jgi:TonB-linked SusC/RagA family outer membrane protein
MKKNNPFRELKYYSLKKFKFVLHITFVLLLTGVLPSYAIDGTKEPVAVQQLAVSGRVTDSQTGEPMPGVNILVKGTTIGSITDINGKYSLASVSGNATLVFSFIGYVSQEVSVSNKATIDISLVSEVKGLDEVVVVGYGTQKKVNLTGSVSSISSEVLENRPVPNVGTALLGVSPNLNIELSGYGGEPGASVNWNIRGMGSISGNDSPLILVDGVEMDINNLDPSNIESISILKDASASAIYGSRAPFGVVLITTKKGKRGDAVSIEYNNNIAFGAPLGIAHMENSVIFATAYNQASANAGSPAVFPDEQVQRMQGWLDGTYTTEYDPANPPNSIWSGRRVGNASYDWPGEYIRKQKIDQKHNINISGGTDRTQYYISLGLYDEGSFYADGYDDYKRYDVMANFNSKITNWLSFDLSTKYAKSSMDYPLGITTVERRYFFHNLYLFGPNTPKYNINGSSANAMSRSIEGSGRDMTDRSNLIVTVGSEIEPIKGWKTNISFNFNETQLNQTVNPKPIMVELGTGAFGNVGKPSAAYEAMFSRSPYELFNVITSYEKTLGNHYIKGLVGYEQDDKFYTYLYARGDNLITNEVPSISTALGTKTIDDTKYDWATQGIFGRLNYNFKEKYLIEFSTRYNGSSRFAPGSRWGFFPSGSAGYQVSKENFWSPVEPYVNRLKLRASYGSLGNQNVSSYLYIPSVPIVNEAPWIIAGERPPYAQTPSLISQGLTWEKITTFNFGVDAGFLKNRLELTFDWFNRQTADMFGPQETLPYTLGTGTPTANNAEMETKGYEIVLSWKDNIKSDFSYNAQISIGDSRSTILRYRNESGFIDSWYNGKNVGEIWGFVSDGLIQDANEEMPNQTAIYSRWQPGDMKYRDLNGDGKITTGNRTLDDHGDLTVIGNNTPRFNIGIAGGFNWKGIDFNMHWAGIGKYDYYPSTESVTFWGLTTSWGGSAVLKGTPVLDYWRPADETNIFGPNTGAYLPRPYFSSETNKNTRVQSKYLLNAAYLRLKNVQLGYTVPAGLSQKIHVQKARIFISGENLITFKSVPKAIDPEQTITAGYTNTGAFYPLSRSYSIGLNVKF